MNNPFYIPIKSVNLAHYLLGGIIMPSIYIENRNEDIQDRFKNYLLFSSSKYTVDTDCAIEIILNDAEEAPEQLTKHFYLFNMPLPISRIKNIYFTSEEQKINTDFNISSGAAFIPQKLLKVADEKAIDTKELNGVKFKGSEQDWTGYLKKYDQILGGFSSMKIGKEKFQNYPTHYFSALGNINNLFDISLTQQEIPIENKFKFAFVPNGNHGDFYNTIYSEIDSNKVQEYADKDRITLEVKNGLIRLDKIDENKITYYVAILGVYGKGKRKSVDSFVSDLVLDKFNATKKEGLSLIFGLNNGYKAFRNKYKTDNFDVDIKFRLEKRIDYYIIESIYQKTFNSLDDILSFKYIDTLFPKTVKENTRNSHFDTYKMIDETIIWKERILSPIEKVISKILDKINSWFINLSEEKKTEIETLIQSDIKNFKEEIESELVKKYDVELKQNAESIKKLRSEISEKDNKIQILEKQLKDYTSELIKNEANDSIDENTGYYADGTGSSVVNESVQLSLFSNEPELNKIQRKEELLKKFKKDIVPIAKGYKINKASSLDKDQLISEIIKYEFKE